MKRSTRRRGNQERPRLGGIDPSLFYTPGKTIFHDLHPISKLLFLIETTVYSSFERSIVLLSLNLLLQAIFLKLGRISLTSVVKRLKWIIIFTLLMIPVNILFNATTNQNDTILFYLFNTLFPIRRLVVYFTVRTVIIIFILLLSTFTILGTTTQYDLVYGIIHLVTYYKIKKGVEHMPYTLGFSLIAGLRYIPIIREDTNKVILAQQARGLSKGSTKRFRDSLVLLRERIITTLLIILKKSESSAISMDIRGFGMSKKRTYINKPGVGKKDVAFVAISSCLYLFLLLYSLGILPSLPAMISLYEIFL
ncbi:MAG: energy-coupling factor transporter transmembrane component T family protein [Promethearchaeota archaeon]